MNVRKLKRRAARRMYYRTTQVSYSDFARRPWGGSLRQSVEQVERWRQSPEGQRLAALWKSADMHIHDEATHHDADNVAWRAIVGTMQPPASPCITTGATTGRNPSPYTPPFHEFPKP